MSNSAFSDFGVVDPSDDYYELHWETGKARPVHSHGNRADGAWAA